ncbi:MAG: YihY/virulence factor BrkB family protein [Gemmatimonadota bacterium]|nr:YihY/virulence factor BrkB family protein [Gemmatimonadota bacterium]
MSRPPIRDFPVVEPSQATPTSAPLHFSPRAEKGERAGEESLPRRVWSQAQADDVLGGAAQIAYFFFLSLPPAILVLFGLTGFFGGQGVADWLTGQLQTALPAEASGLIQRFVDQVVHENAPGPFSIGLVLALWASSNVFTALTKTLNDAYGVEESRPWWKQRIVSLGVMLTCGVLFLAGSAVLIAGPQIAGALQLGGVADLAWTVLQWPLAFAIVVATFWIIYYVLPNRDQKRSKGTLVKASAIAAALWLLATLAFRIYISNFGSYGETYGLLGTVIVLLLWMYITGVVILVGGEVASEMEAAA